MSEDVASRVQTLRVLTALVLALAACAPARAQEPKSAFKGRLEATGPALRYRDGGRFQWRGMTAFRLVELAARGRDADVDRYLAWAASQDVTVVRVLTMTRHMFRLTPADGRAALPRVLTAAARHGVYVEIVALADTAAYADDIAAHVRAIGEIAARHENALVEIANEPDHGTQRRELADPARLLALARLVPDTVPVALGAGASLQDRVFAVSRERPNTYLTAHFPRSVGQGGWGAHLSLRAGLRIQAEHKRFLVDDEPIGAGEVTSPGSRDADPIRWFGRGLIARVLRMGSTFHSDAGLQAAIPTGTERACFDAWRLGMSFFPPETDERGVAHDASEGAPADPAVSPLAGYERGNAAGVFSLVDGARAWILAVGVSADPQFRLREGWVATRSEQHDRVWILHLAKRALLEPELTGAPLVLAPLAVVRR